MEEELLLQIGQLKEQILLLETKEQAYIRQIQRDAADLKKKDADRLVAGEFLETIRSKTLIGTKEYEDVDRLIQVLRTR